MKLSTDNLCRLLLLLAVTLGTAATGHAGDGDLAVAVQRVRDGVLTILMRDEAGSLSGQGTGFAVSADGRVVTCAHVIEGAASAIAVDRVGRKFPVQGVIAIDASRDVAILQVKASDLHPVALSDTDDLPLGARVFVLGTPSGLEQTLSDGIVSGHRRLPERGHVIQVTAPASPGSSGSPVFDMTGLVVGLVTSRLTNVEAVHFAAPVGVVAEVAKMAGPARPLNHFVGLQRSDTVRTCMAAAADFSPIYPTDSFPATARPIFAVFQLPPGAIETEVSVRWSAVEVEGFRLLGGLPIGRYSLVNPDGLRVGYFSLNLTRPLPVGAYRVEVFVGGKRLSAADFNVAPPPPPLRVSDPTVLQPIGKGSTWRYDHLDDPLVGEAVPPGMTLGRDGRRRSSTTFVVEETEGDIARVVCRNSGEFFNATWLRREAAGLSQQRSRSFRQEEPEPITPPSLLLPAVLDGDMEWTWSAADGQHRTVTRAIGPLTVETPKGRAPGYVVLTSTYRGAALVGTLERHMAPGWGIVRRTYVTTGSRCEMILIEKR